MLTLGSVLQDQYRTMRLLGQGGMGAVYLATHLALDKSVAIKEINSSSPASLRQFETEATILAGLAHPNLPTVMDFFVQPDGSRYLVMEFIEGKNLEQIVAKRGRLRKEIALRWMAQVFEAVEYIHANGIIHRDIKPQNIVINSQDQAVLVDFGIAKVLASGQSTLTGARAGTAGYAPPEQYRGGTDARSDVYALGATLYFLLTGQVPQSALPRAAGTTLTPPRQLNPAISPNTETVILTAMRLAANQRYGAVSEMKQVLQTETPIVVREQKRSLQSAPLVVAGMVLVTLVLAVLFFIRQGQPELTGGISATTVLAVDASPTTTVTQAAVAFLPPTPTATASVPASPTPLPPTPSPSATVGPIYRLDIVSGSDYYPKFSQATLGSPKTDPYTTEVKVAVGVTNLANGTQSRLFERPSGYYGTITSATWSRDGSRVLVAYGWRGKIRNISEYQYNFENGSSGIVEILRDGSTLQNVAVGSGRPFTIGDSWFGYEVNYYRSAIWSPDEQRLALVYRVPIDLVNPRGGAQCTSIMNRDGTALKNLPDCQVDDFPRYWSVDGKWILVWAQSEKPGRRLWGYEVDGSRRVSLATLIQDKVRFYDQRYYPWRIVDQPKCDENSYDFWTCE